MDKAAVSSATGEQLAELGLSESSYQHLKDIPLPELHGTNVGILIGADMSHLFIQSDHRIGASNQPIAVIRKGCHEM